MIQKRCGTARETCPPKQYYTCSCYDATCAQWPFLDLCLFSTLPYMHGDHTIALCYIEVVLCTHKHTRTYMHLLMYEYSNIHTYHKVIPLMYLPIRKFILVNAFTHPTKLSRTELVLSIPVCDLPRGKRRTCQAMSRPPAPLWVVEAVPVLL